LVDKVEKVMNQQGVMAHILSLVHQKLILLIIKIWKLWIIPIRNKDKENIIYSIDKYQITIIIIILLIIMIWLIITNKIKLMNPST
jgi:hypothetical protein